MLEENPQNEVEYPVIPTGTPRKDEQKEKGHKEIKCLHVSNTDSLSRQASAALVDLGVQVTCCSEIEKAKVSCENEAFGVIILEEITEENKDFITNLKIKGSLNEQTPVIYIAQGIPSEDIKRLVKDQYIDDIVFKCSSVDSDLIKAVKRLINEPLQFAVTPKSKRESATPKSKKGESSGCKRQKLEKKIPMSARRCIANNFPSTDEWSTLSMNGIHEDGTTFLNLDSSTAAHHAAVYEPSINPEMAVMTAQTHDQTWMSSQHQQYNHYIQVNCAPEYHPSPQETTNKMELLTAAAEMSQAMMSLKEPSPQNTTNYKSNETTTGSDEPANLFTRLKHFFSLNQDNTSSCTTTPEAQLVSSSTVNPMQIGSTAAVNPMQIALENAERVINSSLPEMLADELVPKITLSGARQLLDSALLGVQPRSQKKKAQNEKERETHSAQKNKKCIDGLSKTSVDGCDKGKDEEKPKRSQRGRRSGTFNMEKQEWTSSTSEERKELHLSKERKRRERIARCWHQLRRMIPMCADNADKATVFEMTVAYLHHCWKHHAPIILKINKDFEKFYGENGPPEDLDEVDNLVTKLLDLDGE